VPARLLKVDPRTEDPSEREFDLAYYGALSAAERFRMLIERSILLRRIAERHAADREAPSLVKRR
jgi:hypothetical protein